MRFKVSLKLKKDGFTLIEVLVASFILVFGLLGLSSLLINSLRLNEKNQMRITAEKILSGSVSQLRSVNIINFTKDILESSFGFSETIPPGYPDDNKVKETCGNNYSITLFRIYSIEKEVMGNKVIYKYTQKLCVWRDYLPPFLGKAETIIYWKFGGMLHNEKTIFFISAGE